MNFEQLRCFLAVAETLNFTQAAKQLFLGQPALSRQVAELEKEVGVQLFDRNNRKVKLTAAGAVLYKYSCPILDESVKAVEMTRQAGLGFSESLRIGYLGLEYKHLPQAIGSYHKNHPTSDISARRFTWHELNEALFADEVDIAFTFSSGLEAASGIAWQNISRNPLTVVVPCNHPMAKKSKIHLSTLAKEAFIQTSPKTAPLANAISIGLCLKNGFTPNIVHCPEYVETALMLVEAGTGISILPHDTSFFSRPNICFINIDDDDAYIDMVINWKKDNTKLALANFLCEIRRAFSLNEM